MLKKKFQLISYFYYRRSSYFKKLSEARQKNFKIKNLNVCNDFEICVLENQPECQYRQDMRLSDNDGRHKSLVAQFCGHQPVSKEI